MQAPPSPHPGAVRSTIVRSSTIEGSRQSQWPAKQPLLVVPSRLVALFRVPRKVVNAVPSGRPRVGLQSNSFASSCTLPSSVFCSHWSPVSKSVTVPSPFIWYRHGIAAVVASAFRVASLASKLVWHFAGSAGLACRALPFSVAWHFRSFPHASSFFARQAGVVSALAGHTPPTSTAPATTARHSVRPHREPDLSLALVRMVSSFSRRDDSPAARPSGISVPGRYARPGTPDAPPEPSIAAQSPGAWSRR